MIGTATLGGVSTGLAPVNVWMATLCFAGSIVGFSEWHREWSQ